MLEQLRTQTFRFQNVTGILESTSIPLIHLLDDLLSQFSFDYNKLETGLRNMDTYKNAGLFILLLPLLCLFKKNKKEFTIQLLILSFLFVALTLKGVPLSKISILEIIQFPSRLYIIVIVINTFVIVSSIEDLKHQKVVLGVITLFIIFNISFLYYGLIKDENVIRIDNDATYEEIYVDGKYSIFNLNETNENIIEIANAEYLPYKYVNFKNIPDYPYYDDWTCVDESYKRSGTKYIFSVCSDEERNVTVPTTYYYGYRVYKVVNNEYIPVDFSIDDTGMISFVAEARDNTYVVMYKNTKLQLLSTYISVISLSSIMFYIIKKKDISLYE